MWLNKNTAFVTGCTALAKDMARCLNFLKGSVMFGGFIMQDYETTLKLETLCCTKSSFNVEEM